MTGEEVSEGQSCNSRNLLVELVENSEYLGSELKI
jgi:hypothetical protein